MQRTAHARLCRRHIFDPLARCSQVRADREDWMCEAGARRAPSMMVA